MAASKYFDTETRIIATAFKAEEVVRFFNAIYGPHGYASPGQWVVADAVGFCMAMDESDFEKRFIKIEMQQIAWKSASDEDFAWVLG